MKHQIALKNIEHEASIQERLNFFISKLETQLASLPPDLVFLHGVLEKHPKRQFYHLSLNLNLPGRTLSAREGKSKLEAVLNAAFQEIDRQLKKHKAFLRREHIWKRPARRKKLRKKIKANSHDDQQRQLFFDLIKRHLRKLYNYVRREISYSLATGDLPRNQLIVQDVIDTVVLQAYEKFREKPSDVELDRWLVELARKYLRSEVQHFRKDRTRYLHIEEDVPGTPPEEQVVTLGDEVLDFYQPDEDLQLEDVVPDLNMPTPEQIVERREMRRFIDRVLASLPPTWRDALVLHHVEGFSTPQIARIMSQSEDDVKRQLERAREFLKQKVLDSGLTPPA